MDLMLDWTEVVALSVLIVGFGMALIAANALTVYAVCFLMGLLFGRIWYRFRLSNCMPLFFAVMAFFLGFILGGMYANMRVIALLLLAGMLSSYWLHTKKIIRTH